MANGRLSSAHMNQSYIGEPQNADRNMYATSKL